MKAVMSVRDRALATHHPARSTPVTDLIQQLDQEWTRFDRRPDVKQFMATLADHPLLVSPTATRLVQQILDCPRTDRRRADDLLRALMELAVGPQPSPVAQRMVLQALIPGMCGILTRMGARPRTPSYPDLVAEVVSATAHRIATYPLATRPAGVFLGILKDVERDRKRERIKHQAVTFSGGLSECDGVIGRPLVDAFGRLGYDRVERRLDLTTALSRAYRARSIGDREIDMIIATKFRDEDVETVAASYGLSYDSGRRTVLRAATRLAPYCSGYGPSPAVAA